MKTWEYQDVAVLKSDPASTIPLLDEAGRQGWETTGIIDENHHYRIYLMKRPLESAEEEPVAKKGVKHSHSIRYTCNRNCPQNGTIHEITRNTY